MLCLGSLLLVARVRSVKSEDGSGAAEAFLRDNAKRKGVQTIEGGIQYEVLREASRRMVPVARHKATSTTTGAATRVMGDEEAPPVVPTEDDTVIVHYQMFLTDGTLEDSSWLNGSPVVLPVKSARPPSFPAIVTSC